ncbi:MAG: hypothetical protein PF636_00940, partial [Actinomycetota bacterium]|nr:hypothetical protein [Actinomycetota bacterium]
MTRSGRTPAPRLILMTRFPEAGTTKTRLASTLGDERSARVHDELARHCLRRMRLAAALGKVALEVRVTGSSATQARQWLGAGPDSIRT